MGFCHLHELPPSSKVGLLVNIVEYNQVLGCVSHTVYMHTRVHKYARTRTNDGAHSHKLAPRTDKKQTHTYIFGYNMRVLHTTQPPIPRDGFAK